MLRKGRNLHNNSSFSTVKWYMERIWRSLLWKILYPKIHMLNPNTQCDESRWKAFGRWLGQEGGALVNGTCALIRDPREPPHSFYHMRTQWKDCCLWARKQTFTRHWILWCLAHRLLKFQNCEKFLLFLKPPSMSCFCYSSPKKLRQPHKDLVEIIWVNTCKVLRSLPDT